jgi:hypothetical protein
MGRVSARAARDSREQSRTAGLRRRLTLEPLESRDCPGAVTVYSADMEADPAWTYDPTPPDSLWQWGTPQGLGGQQGQPDPTQGHTGLKVLGYNLSGDYPNGLTTTHWATTPAIDCSQLVDVKLQYYRWLNVEDPAADHARIEASADGGPWSNVWENGTEITDDPWTAQEIDLTAVAAMKSQVRLRWGLGPTDKRDTYSGWNLDDVTVTGQRRSLDIDGNGKLEPLIDGLLILRYLTGFRGVSLVRGTSTPDATRTTPAQVTTLLDALNSTMLDVDADGSSTGMVDGILILRYLCGYRGSSLVRGVVTAQSQRSDAAQMATFLDDYQPSASKGVMNPSPKDARASRRGGIDPVGWVERSEPHHLDFLTTLLVVRYPLKWRVLRHTCNP